MEKTRVIKVAEGELTGLKRDGYEDYLGVPYAAPPVGEGRFAPPRPAVHWEGVRECDAFPAMAMQAGQMPDSPYLKEFYSNPEYDVPKSEDCLYLNIRVPDDGKKTHPVAVWIHGGAFLGGYASELEFDGTALTRDGIIVVAIQYRLGIFGFFSCKDLSKEQGGRSGNYAILDQIAAVNWVHDNIAAFGGDPENITIFGQSAGCMSVQTLISSPLLAGKVKRAILQSGCGYHNNISRNRTQEMAEAEGEEILAAENLSLEAFRALPADQILMAGFSAMGRAMANGGGNLSLLFTPVIDGVVLSDGYDALIDAGKTLPIPTLLGSTENDLTCTPESIAAGELSRLYQSCIDWALMEERQGRAPAYVYYFKRRLPGDDWGAFHSSELWYTFGSYGKCWRPLTEADADLSSRMSHAFAGFITMGDPNWGGEASWRPCTKDDPFVMVYDV